MRVRLVRVVVQPEYMVDDGENLQPLSVAGENGQSGNPVKIVSAADWGEFSKDGIETITATLQTEVDAQYPGASNDG